jgi:hypothetical protein
MYINSAAYEVITTRKENTEYAINDKSTPINEIKYTEKTIGRK